jgi:hypothetical protein
MDLVAFENALHAWVAGAAGVEAIWSSQNAPAPALPYLTLRLVGPVRLGDQLASRTNLANPAGQEIERTLTEHEEWTLSVHAFASPATGASAARALLQAAALKMQLPSQRDALSASGLALVEVGDTSDLTALVGSQHESRAQMDVRLRTVDQATEKTGYIAKVGLASPWGTFDAP